MQPLQNRARNRGLVTFPWTGLAMAGLLGLTCGTPMALAQVESRLKAKTIPEVGDDESMPEPASVETAIRVLDLRDFPTMDGAVIPGPRRLGQLNYQAKGSPQEAFEFQQRNLLERGWKELPGSQAESTSLSAQFTKAGFLAYVFTARVAGDASKVGWAQVKVVNYGNVLTGTLPVPPGAKAFYPDVTAAAYVTDAKVPETLEACRVLLVAEKWAPYGTAGSSVDSAMQFFKRNAIRLRVWVSKSPAAGGKTTIRYSTELLSADLPVPRDARNPRYDDGLKIASFDWPDQNLDLVFAFYEKTLPAQGWTPTTERSVADVKKEKQLQTFRNPQGDSISIDAEQNAGLTRVKVRHQSSAEAAEMDGRVAQELKRLKPEQPATPKTRTEHPAKGKETLESRNKGTVADVPDTGKRPEEISVPRVPKVAKAQEDPEQGAAARQKVADRKQAPQTKPADPEPLTANKEAVSATKEIQAPDHPAAGDPAAADPSVGAPAKVSEIPVPKDVAEIDFGKATNMITLKSPSDVATLVTFYTDGLKESGWTKGAGGLVMENSAILKLSKGDAALTIFIDRTEETSDVAVMSRGIDWGAVAPTSVATVETREKVPAAPDSAPPEESSAVATAPEKPVAKSVSPDDASPPSHEEDRTEVAAAGSVSLSAAPAPRGSILEADERNGLPFPQESTDCVATSLPCRKTVRVVTSALMEPLLDFYRRELTARGWKENPDAAITSEEKARLLFSGPEGKLSLRLLQKEKQVSVALVARDPVKARAVGLLPQPNRGRIVLTNSQNHEAALTVNGKVYRLAAGLGAKDPKEGKSLHVQPGRYNLVLKAPGEPDKTEALNVRVDETWSVTIDPADGLLTDQLY